MTTKTPEELLADCGAWRDTAIIDIHPGKIAIRGYPIEELIGRVRFPDMIWLMLRGEFPSRGQSDLLEAAMAPGVDHGPQPPTPPTTPAPARGRAATQEKAR
jgi:citrate synthase